jgi:hypothetical protein
LFVFKDEFGIKFGLSGEPVLITLLYNTPVCPVVKVSQYQTQHDSEGLILIRSMVEHFFTVTRMGDASLLRPLPYPVAKASAAEVPKFDQTVSVKNLFTNDLSHGRPDDKHVSYIVSMGFTKAQAIKALVDAKANLDVAVDLLVSAPIVESNLFVDLKEYLTDRFLSLPSYCLACNNPHRCGGALPIICGRDLCVFYFEERLGSRVDCRLCPMGKTKHRTKEKVLVCF